MTITIESLDPVPTNHRVVSVTASARRITKQFRPRRTRRLMERDVLVWLHETYGRKQAHLRAPLVITVQATLVTPTLKETTHEMSRITVSTKEV